MLLIVCMQHAIALNYISKQTCGIHTTDYISVYEKFTVQFASVGLSLARTNYYMYNHYANTHQKGQTCNSIKVYLYM